MSYRILARVLLSATLAFPVVAAAAETEAQSAKSMPMMGGGMGQHCKHKGMQGGQGGCGCKTAEALEKRIESLEKRLDMMQATLEMMARQAK